MRIEIVRAGPERVSSLQPRKIRRGDILVIAEQERIAGIVVADVGPTAVDLKRGNAALQSIGTVGPRDSQDVESKVRNDIETFRTESLACVADVCIQNN